MLESWIKSVLGMGIDSGLVGLYMKDIVLAESLAVSQN